ncbi:MAG: DUF2911 domain-containing protein [Lewinellaceae bacterium]|nr:DUF2911 domain-containing protein [Phaeodactylibacter sp.]MCB9346226.1 DUF2911 domain-containing protein [Lewinellaceae bacterium]
MRKVLLKLSAMLLLISFSALDLSAQIQTPAPSPSSELKQAVGLTDVTIVYSRPSVKGREIFAEDGLVPYGKPWRLGANAATKFSFSKDVEILGTAMKAGDYAVLASPNANEWKFMFYPYESGSWNSYLEKEPAATVSVKPMKGDAHVESMTFNIANVQPTSADIVLSWAKTMVTLPLQVNTDDQVMASIERVMSGPSQDDYFAAATYYHESGKDLNQALAWVEKATAGDEPRFWQVRRKALILADLGKTEAAIKAATLSLKLAEAAGNEDYVRMNKKSIEEWTAKK